jgi:hypothetical protein
MLLAEEVAAHQQLTGKPSSPDQQAGKSVHAALLRLLHAASHQQALLQHAECVLAPAVQVMRQLEAQQQLQVQQLQAENERLKVCMQQACLLCLTVMQPPSAPSPQSLSFLVLLEYQSLRCATPSQ